MKAPAGNLRLSSTVKHREFLSSIVSYAIDVGDQEIQRTQIKAKEKLPAGKVQIDVVSKLVAPKPGAPLDVTISVNGKPVAQVQVPITAPLAFTANDCLDIGSDLGSPVSIDYFDKAPFAFNGTIGTTKITYPPASP